MRANLLRFLFAAAGGVLWGLCFSREPLSLASWLALAPLVALLSLPRPGLLGWVHGLASWLTGLYWITPTLVTYGQMPRPLAVVLTGVLAALVAVTRSMVVPVSTTAGFELTVSAMIVTVVGGLGSVAGALLAGIVLGVVSTVAASTVGTVLSLVILLVAAAVTILIRPSGLLGVRE